MTARRRRGRIVWDIVGVALFVVGYFTSAGSIAAANVARWDGTAWSALGGGVNSYAHAIASFQEQPCSPAQLYVGAWSFHDMVSPLDVWIDDLVVDTKPVACPAP